MLQTTNYTPPKKKNAFEIDIFPTEIKTITNKFNSQIKKNIFNLSCNVVYFSSTFKKANKN